MIPGPCKTRSGGRCYFPLRCTTQSKERMLWRGWSDHHKRPITCVLLRMVTNVKDHGHVLSGHHPTAAAVLTGLSPEFSQQVGSVCTALCGTIPTSNHCCQSPSHSDQALKQCFVVKCCRGTLRACMYPWLLSIGLPARHPTPPHVHRQARNALKLGLKPTTLPTLAISAGCRDMYNYSERMGAPSSHRGSCLEAQPGGAIA